MSVRRMFGRKVIYSDVSDITRSNVYDVLQSAMAVHAHNQADIDYLYKYYRGCQPVLNRTKEVRPEITNMVVENRANEIVSFKVGYLMGEPIQYVSRVDDDAVADSVTTLNNYMLSEDKATKDKELSEWAHICGTSYRMVLPDPADIEPDEAPFEIYTLDPRCTFVVYQNSLGTPPLMAVKYVDLSTGCRLTSVYTKDTYFEFEDSRLVKEIPQQLGIPIIEYPLNTARLGAFEVVLTQLDTINTVESNRIDGIEQFVQALMLFHNVAIDEGEFKLLRKEGALQYKDVDPNLKGEIKYLVEELNQGQTQVVVDHLYDAVLTIVGMPNRNGGTSTSDTGSAVIMRDGWSAAEARAKDSETTFKKSEREFLRLVLKLCDELGSLSLKMSSIDIRFTRRNYENIAEKANVLTTMLNNPKIAPELAFIHCGMFSDPNVAYKMSMEYYERQKQEALPLVDGEGSAHDQPVGKGVEGDQRESFQGESG